MIMGIDLFSAQWMRPPNVEIGKVQSVSGVSSLSLAPKCTFTHCMQLQRLSSGGIQTNLSVIIAYGSSNLSGLLLIQFSE